MFDYESFYEDKEQYLEREYEEYLDSCKCGEECDCQTFDEFFKDKMKELEELAASYAEQTEEYLECQME